MQNYFRILGYLPNHDISAVIDCFGAFNEIWEFSSFLIQKGFKILEAGGLSKFKDVNIGLEKESSRLMLRACSNGAPQYLDYKLDGKIFNAVSLNSKIYIPKFKEL